MSYICTLYKQVLHLQDFGIRTSLEDLSHLFSLIYFYQECAYITLIFHVMSSILLLNKHVCQAIKKLLCLEISKFCKITNSTHCWMIHMAWVVTSFYYININQRMTKNINTIPVNTNRDFTVIMSIFIRACQIMYKSLSRYHGFVSVTGTY